MKTVTEKKGPEMISRFVLFIAKNLVDFGRLAGLDVIKMKRNSKLFPLLFDSK